MTILSVSGLNRKSKKREGAEQYEYRIKDIFVWSRSIDFCVVRGSSFHDGKGGAACGICGNGSDERAKSGY